MKGERTVVDEVETAVHAFWDRAMEPEYITAAKSALRSNLIRSAVVNIRNVAEYFWSDQYAANEPPPGDNPPWPVVVAHWTEPEQKAWSDGIRRPTEEKTRRVIVFGAFSQIDNREDWLAQLVIIFPLLPADLQVAGIFEARIGDDAPSADGQIYKLALPDPWKNILAGFGLSSDQIVHDMQSRALDPLLLSFSFANCRNVKTVAADIPDAIRRKREKQGRIPILRTYTLAIEPMTKVLAPHRASGASISKALHICRGHFKEFTPEKPLFGRFSGRFWWNQSVRGQAEAGVVDKDYTVNAPSSPVGSHEGSA